MGLGLMMPSIGYVFVAIIVVGSLFSYLAHTKLSESASSWCGLFYSVGAIIAFGFRFQLNSLLPEGGIPPELIMVGALAWMLALGSFALWRDTVIIFQAVPTIAIFGLVGAWDTFIAAPFAFFAFLLCFATLFARSHARLMMAQAEYAGFGENSSGSEASQNISSRLKEVHWRWMAGPGWALVSALAVVLLSLLGAPVLQRSVQGVAGNVQIIVPRNRNQPVESRADPFRSTTANTTNVGQGPRQLSDTPVFRTNLERPTYLRSQTYDAYSGRGWTMSSNVSAEELMRLAQDRNSLFSRTQRAAEKGRSFGYRIRFERVVGDSLPIPGVPVGIGGFSFRVRSDLTVANDFFDRRGAFQVKITDPLDMNPTEAGKDLPPVFTNGDNHMKIPERVQRFAEEAIKGAQTDYEKAMALKNAIERQVVYDLKAERVPDGADPVEHFLFESKRGYCDLFASAMVVTARAVGLPARYVTGYYPVHEKRDPDGNLIILESEAHAWADLYFENEGWIPFDATEGADSLGDSTTPSGLDAPWVRPSAFILMGLAVVFIPFAISKFLKSEKLLVDPKQRALVRSYRQFVSALEKQSNKVKRPGQTLSEFLEIARPSLGEHYEQGRVIVSKIEASFYRDHWEGSESVIAEIAEFKKRLTHR